MSTAPLCERFNPSVMQRIRDEIESHQSQIQRLVEEAQEEDSKVTEKPDLNPLELLGMAALLRADGRIPQEEFDRILGVRKAMES